MFKNRLFNILVIAALAVVTALTLQQAVGTIQVVSATEDTSLCAMPAIDRSSIRSVYVKETGVWMSYSDSGPTGVDGGLLYLLSDEQTCSQ